MCKAPGVRFWETAVICNAICSIIIESSRVGIATDQSFGISIYVYGLQKSENFPSSWPDVV